MSGTGDYTKRIASAKTAWAEAGYTLVHEIPNPTGTNACFELTKANKRYFAKVSQVDTPGRIAREVNWSEFVRSGEAQRGPAPFRAPEILAHSEDWVIMDYCEAALLVSSDWAQGEAALRPHIEYLVDCLVWLDGVKVPGLEDPIFTSADSYTVLMKQLDGWLEAPLTAKRLGASAATAAKSVMDARRKLVVPRLAHGDFVPWHFMQSASSKPCLFDGELARQGRARFYDLAYLYTRLYTRAAAPESARASLRRFLEQSRVEPDDFWPGFIFIVTQRAIGMQFDAYNDRNRYDYLAAATDLLERCISADPATFL